MLLRNVRNQAKVVDDFVKKFNMKAKAFYFDLSIIQHISSRRIAKIFKLHFEANNISVSRKELKTMIKSLKFISTNDMSKHEIKRAYKIISNLNFHGLITLEEIIEIIKKYVITKRLEHNSSKPVSLFEKLYLKLGVLRI